MSESIIRAARHAGCNDEFIKMAPDWLERFAATIRAEALDEALEIALTLGGDFAVRFRVALESIR